MEDLGKAFSQEIFEMLLGEDYVTAQVKLDEYFSPKNNVDYQFHQAVQQLGETVDQFITRIRKLAEVHVCVDMQRANKVINGERHPAPTIDDLIHSLNGATEFSKLEL